MGTSRSPEWRAEADLFSGRPNPSWTLDAGAGEQFAGAWAALGPAPLEPSPPVLGYRGVALEAPDGRRWRAFGGVVAYSDGDDVPRLRSDPDRAWERRVLDSAPPDAGVPPITL